jgi:nitroreductase
MDAVQTILTRRSCRKFLNKEVEQEKIDIILKAAMQAPSAGNEQAWRFIVVTDKKLLQEIPKVSPYAQMAKEASLAIIICGDPSLEKFPGFWVQDCSAATQNILLAAHALGLGAVWTASYPMMDRVEGIRHLFNIPDTIIPFAIVPIGYPAQELPVELRYKKERIRKNKW